MDDADPREVGRLWSAAMRRGDWGEAWRQTDRIELPRRSLQGRPGFAWQPHQLVWDGTPFAGRSVLVRCEHGLGDTLQFIRFVPLLASLAHKVIVRLQPHLLPLLVGAPQLGHVCNGWTDEPPPHTDVQIEVMELAYAFRCLPGTVPPPYPHLAARVTGRLPPLDDDGRLKVGLLWAASEWDPSRSISLAVLEPLLRFAGARFFSLQQGDAAGVAHAARLGVEPLSRRTADIATAAAAMLQLDLVITVDAMAAHLAGTLGRPTWVLLKPDADWRWMDGRSDSPWYPGMRLWRQPAAGDWTTVVAAMGAALRSVAETRAGVSPAAGRPVH
ncbi:MAG: hypothetical protein JWQ33_1346 [Ramlibacter sp.]|nr:hypothetical protein [Ramlibacter sp.]